MLEDYNIPRVRALFYGLIVLSSLAVFGNVAELCDIADKCPTRLAVVIAIGVFATIISGLLFLGGIFEVGFVLTLESMLCIILLVALSVTVGLTSSFRTNLQETIALSFSWVGLALTFVVTFLALTCDNTSRKEARRSRSAKPLDVGEEVPEESYMEEGGATNGPEPTVQDESEPMAPVEPRAPVEGQTRTSS